MSDLDRVLGRSRVGGVVRLALWAIAACGISVATAHAQPDERSKQRPERGGLIGRMTAFHTDVPAHPFDVVLVNPTRDSISASVVAYSDVEAYVELVVPSRPAPVRTPVRELKAGEPSLFVLSDLRPDTGYTYRLWTRARATSAGPKAEFAASEPFAFHTPRPAGSSFVFTMVADSHLDAPMTPAIYERALANALADKPDFHIDLGDTFMTDKRGRDFKSAQAQYIAQRYYLGKLCHSAPLLMVLGNHDGEWGYARGDADAMAPWSYAQRTRYFPPPLIGERDDDRAMFSGSTAYTKGQGANYYACTWGDAQLIVLDPFWFTNEKARGPGGRGGGGADAGRRGGEQGGRPASDADTALTDQGWTMTLGKAQYDWLTHTLDASRSAHTFVFIHHLVGGMGRASRGGASAAPYFEWGGKNADGTDGFAAHRPGWSLPIHQLLVKHHVEAVFHGHDHLYVHEELDGVAYQCVPQPGNVNGGTRSAAEYGYRSGTILGSPGHVRVTVSPGATKVEFVRAAAGDGHGGMADKSANRAVVDSYEIPAPRESSK